MSTSYPKIHVVGSGAYYSYRPITRYIEKSDRNHIRESSSRPAEFSKYAAAASALGEGHYHRRVPLSDTTVPPFDRDRKRASDKADDFKHGGDDSFFKHGGDDSLFKRGDDDSFLKRRRDDSFFKRREDDSVTERHDHDASFSTRDDVLTRLRRKHPYRLPVENEVVPPHESSIWPENRPHFDLVSSYDVMVDYLGIRDKSKN